jgi:replicative DNA helicase
MLLCALMDVRNQSAAGTDIERITSTLTAADFEDPAHARMYGHIVDLIAAGQPHDFASVTGALIRSGADGAKDAPLRKRLMGIVTAGAHSVAAVHYADNVLSQSYRRSFHVAGQRLTQAAEEAPEADLFDYMVELGTRQRAAFNRLTAFRQPRP